jgi:hypothetical protein
MGLHLRTAASACLLLLSSVARGQDPGAAQPPPGATAPPQYAPPPQVATPPPQYAPMPAPPPEPSLVRQYAVGPRLIIAPGVFIPSSGSAGFTLGIIGGYGFDLGPVILTPGVIGQGSWSSDWTVYSGLGGLRVTLPLGNFGPYVEAAIGYGHVGGPFNYSAGGLALRGGAGFIFFFSAKFALGVAVGYDTIVDTGYKSWTIAPLILLSF